VSKCGIWGLAFDYFQLKKGRNNSQPGFSLTGLIARGAGGPHSPILRRRGGQLSTRVTAGVLGQNNHPQVSNNWASGRKAVFGGKRKRARPSGKGLGRTETLIEN